VLKGEDDLKNGNRLYPSLMAPLMTNSDAQISELRDVVRKLKPTGVDGFEGLMAAVLTAITKTTFSLAKSGSQGKGA
jgi:hypothetical protein